MPDREKVIDGLIMLKRFLPSTMWEPINDALVLLKEQEPIWNDVLHIWTCPSCGQMVSTSYCRDCGRKVKWE